MSRLDQKWRAGIQQAPEDSSKGSECRNEHISERRRKRGEKEKKKEREKIEEDGIA